MPNRDGNEVMCSSKPLALDDCADSDIVILLSQKLVTTLNRHSRAGKTTFNPGTFQIRDNGAPMGSNLGHDLPRILISTF
jgi:hypothetical protein